MFWLSVDPAKGEAGVCIWEGRAVVETSVIRKRGSKGLYYFGEEVHPGRLGAWVRAITKYPADTLVMEKGAGGRANIIDAQGWVRGYIDALSEVHGIRSVTVNVSEWRRCISEAFSISWPRDRDRKKALAVRLVKEHYGLDVTNDEADAVLVGLACIRMGIVSV